MGRYLSPHQRKERDIMSNIVPEVGEVACYHHNGSVTIISDKVFTRAVMLQQIQDQLGVQPRCVSYSVGAKMYSVSEKFFRDWVNEIGAVHRVKGRVLVDLDAVEKFLQYT